MAGSTSLFLYLLFIANLHLNNLLGSDSVFYHAISESRTKS